MEPSQKTSYFKQQIEKLITVYVGTLTRRTSMYKNEELMAHLERLEDKHGREPKANDAARDDDSPVPMTFYNRFGPGWPSVIETYEKWKSTGELPKDPNPTDWIQFHRKLEEQDEQEQTEEEITSEYRDCYTSK